MAASMLRKGTSHPSGAYDYVCGCGFKNPDCSYCCGNDLKRCQIAIKTARGDVYYGLLKTILTHIGKAMVADARSITIEQGKFTVSDLGWISIVHDLNFKATAEWLEETGAIRSGIYGEIKDRKLKVSDILEAARKKYMRPVVEETV